MTKEEAKEKFAKYLEDSCPTCSTPAGELCDTPSVWIHASRVAAAERDKWLTG